MTPEAQGQGVLIDAEQREALGAAWREILSQATPLVEDAEARLTELLDQTLPLPNAAQALGAGLAAIPELQTAHFVAMQARLAGLVGATAPAESLGRFLAELAAGFYLAKAEAARRFNMDAATKMGHDLKTPINAITGFSKVILKGIDGPINDMQQEDLTSIYNGGQKLLNMIHDLFEVMKSDAEKSGLYAPDFALASLVGDVVTTLQPLASRGGHTFELQCRGNLSEPLRADASMVRWVVLGIALQALQRAAPGMLSLAVSRETVEGGGGVTFEVFHTHPDTTDPIVSLSDVYKSVQLVTVQNFCAQLGGELTISQEGERIMFRASLPMQPPVTEE